MKKAKTVSFMVSLAVIYFMTGCTSQPTDVSEEISNANSIFMDAFNQGEMDAVAQNYTEDAKLFPANSEVISGRENIKGFWTHAPEMGVKKVNLETIVAEGYGNTAIEEGKYKLYTDNDIVIDEGKYIVTWKKIDTRWLINRDIWTTNYPITVGPNLQIGNSLGLHAMEITLKGNVSFSDFETYYKEVYIPEFENSFTGIKLYLLKGNRGANEGKYGELYIVKSTEEGNSWEPEEGVFSEKGLEAWNKFKPTQEKLNELIDYQTIYTDWVVQ